MHLSFARLGPYQLNKLVSKESETISCETESNDDSHSLVREELYNGRKIALDFRFDELERILYKVVVKIENLKHQPLSGGIIRHSYDLRFRRIIAA